MPISQIETEYIAHLARLQIEPSAINQYAHNLSDILDYVAQLNAVDTQAIKPMAHPLDAEQCLRNDKVTEIDQRELFQAIAPLVEAGFYLVPKVIE